MATDYPGAIDTTSKLPNPAAGNFTNNPTHAGLHDNTNDAVKATQTKLGTGASTPVVSTLLFGTGTGTSAWTQLTSAQLAASLSDETGTGSAVFATTPTLVTPKVDTINENTPSNGTTIGGVNIKSGALNTSNSVVTSNITDGAVTSPKVAAGIVVQVVSSLTSAVATGTTVIPYDDTIPQITEGDQYMTCVITPKSATNILVIESLFFGGSSVAVDNVNALFQDATANALVAISVYQATATGGVNIKLVHTMTAATTSPTTFRLRAGPGSAATMTFNGQAAGRKFSTITKSSMTIWEYKV